MLENTNKICRNNLLILCLLVLSFGCSTKILENYVEPNNMVSDIDTATVVFYRPDQLLFINDLIEHDEKWTVVIDDEVTKAIGENESFSMKIKPGFHRFNTRTNYFNAVKDARLEAGKVYFFRVYGEGRKWWEKVSLSSGPYIVFAEETREKAINEISNMNRLFKK